METMTFRLADFEGPLDLLLYLISKNKMKIADIEIVSLIDQYLEIVNGPQGASLDATSEFIEMAARLIYMKSVFLLPRSEEQDQLREELTGQLVEYAACKRIAQTLAQMAQGTFVAVRAPMEIELDSTYRIRHDPAELERAYGNLMGGAQRKKQPTQERFEPLVATPFVSVASRAVFVLRNLVRGRVRHLSALFRRSASRSENIGTFLAVLELLKAGRITVDENARLTLQSGRKGRKHGGSETV